MRNQTRSFAVRRRRDFFPRETIPPAIIRSIGVALILCAIKRFINRADKFGNNRGRGEVFARNIDARAIDIGQSSRPSVSG